MKDNNKLKRPVLGSIKDESVLRKFTIFFAIMSFLPLLIIFIVFREIDFSRFDLLDEASFKSLIVLLFAASILGFWGTRRMFKAILNIAKKADEVAEGKLPEDLEIRQNDEIGKLAKSFNKITRRLEDNILKLKASKKILQDVLYRISVGISSTHKIDSFLELIVETIVNALDANIGVLLLLDSQKNELYLRASYGIDKKKGKSIRFKSPETAAGWVIKQGKPLLVPYLDKQRVSADSQTLNLFESPLICVPLIYQDKIIGTLSVSGRKTKENFGNDDLLLLSNLASQTSIALENARLHEDVEKTYFETISALAIAVEAKDPYSRGHSQHVAEYAEKIAKHLNLDEQTINTIKDAALLHDIGKIGISDDILKKPADLDPQECQLMHQHPLIGESIIKPIHSLVRLCDIIRHHHEFLDGSGYPDGLRGDEILLPARILAVADSFDAMTAKRPYRKGMNSQQAKNEIKRYSGIHYDPKVIEALFEVV